MQILHKGAWLDYATMRSQDDIDQGIRLAKRKLGTYRIQRSSVSANGERELISLDGVVDGTLTYAEKG